MHNFSENEARVLDRLSDGQWYSTSKIQKNHLKSFKNADALRDFLLSLVERGYLLAGANNSYRFLLPYLEEWRTFRNLTSHYSKDTNAPRYFGGILEDDGWLLAPLRSHDLVHFRAAGDITQERVQRAIGLYGVANQDSDGLIRISTAYGTEISKFIKEWGEEEGVDISGARLDVGVRRRELAELPRDYVEDFCKFYVSFSRNFLKTQMTSVKKHIADPDDIQQQIYLWIIHAIQRYDASTSIPFAAYLHSSLKRWVHDLNRKSYGRAAADNELKYARAISAFTSQHGRQPTNAELAVILKEDEATVREKINSITLVNNLRSMAPIDDGEREIPLADAGATAEEELAAETDRAMLSALLTSTALEEGKTPRVIGWLGLYSEFWGDKKIVRKKQSEEAILTAMQARAKEIVK